MQLCPKIVSALPDSMVLASPSSCPLLPRALVLLVLPTDLRGNSPCVSPGSLLGSCARFHVSSNTRHFGFGLGL